MKLNGLTNKEVAKGLLVSEPTLYAWAKDNPEFKHALEDSGDFIDQLVEGSLLKRALGFTYTEVEEKHMVTGRIQKKVTHKTVLPDTTAIIFWLKNRKRDQWKDRWEFTGKDGGPIQLSVEDVDQKLKEKFNIIDAEVIDAIVEGKEVKQIEEGE
jgi:hypothetical protein